MAGPSADERIALMIETDAKLQGIRSARAEVKGLGADTEAAAVQSAAAQSAAAKTFQAGIGDDLKALRAFERSLNVTNQTAVKAFRESAAAQREQMVAFGASAQQLRQLDATVRKFETSVEKAALAQSRINSRVRTGASGMATLAYTASGAASSVQGATFAMGTLAEGIAVASKNAKLAASASGIGALAIALGVLVALAIEAKNKMREIPEGAVPEAVQKHIDNLKTVKQVEADLFRARAAADKATAAVGRFGDDKDLKAAVNANAKVTALQIRLNELRADEAERIRDAAKAAREKAVEEAKANHDLQQKFIVDIQKRKAGDLDVFTQRRLEVERTYKDEQDQVRKLKTLSKDAADQTIALAHQNRDAELAAIKAEQEAVRERARVDVGLGSDNVITRHQARMQQIADQRDADIKAGIDVLTATERMEQRKRQIYRETMQAASADAKTIVDVLLDSGSKQVKAVGQAADTVRRVLIGAQAAHAAVEAAIEAGKAIGSLATGDFRGAGLHAAAAAELGKAAALGAKESLGGGGNSGGSGGGGGTTFTPRERGEGGGAQVLNLYTVDPYSREAISVVSYELGRSGVLKKPINIPPTTGFTGRAA